MAKPYHIVFTTIHHPDILNDLYVNIHRYNHQQSVKIWVIGDKKTPSSCGELARSISDKGLETVYVDIAHQDEWGKRCLDFYKRIPYNNETRRNIGYLMALEDNCELLISIDDDNFPTDDDFIGCHLETGTTWKGECINEASGFHNICEYLKITPERQVFPRGYPFSLRGTLNRQKRKKPAANRKIGVTAGLWLSDPDVDATTWLNGKVTATEYSGENVQVLEQDTWTPVNTQNTSLVRALIPAYLCIPMGWDVPGGKIQRYGDIWGGYFLQALMRGTEYHIAFGRPIVDHRRNPHDYVDDLRSEYWGMILTDWLLEKLRSGFFPKQKEMVDRVEELADFIKVDLYLDIPAWCPHEVKDFLFWTEGNLRTWANACRKFI